LLDGRKRDFATIRVLSKIEHFSYSDWRIINAHEDDETCSQTDPRHKLSDLWREAGREVRTQGWTAPHNAAP